MERILADNFMHETASDPIGLGRATVLPGVSLAKAPLTMNELVPRGEASEKRHSGTSKKKKKKKIPTFVRLQGEAAVHLSARSLEASVPSRHHQGPQAAARSHEQ